MDRAIAAEAALYELRGKFHELDMAYRTERDSNGQLRQTLAVAESPESPTHKRLAATLNEKQREIASLGSRVSEIASSFWAATRRAELAEKALGHAPSEEPKALPGPETKDEPMPLATALKKRWWQA